MCVEGGGGVGGCLGQKRGGVMCGEGWGIGLGLHAWIPLPTQPHPVVGARAPHPWARNYTRLWGVWETQEGGGGGGGGGMEQMVERPVTATTTCPGHCCSCVCVCVRLCVCLCLYAVGFPFYFLWNSTLLCGSSAQYGTEMK